MLASDLQHVSFTNVWQQNDPVVTAKVEEIWRTRFRLTEDEINLRKSQLVYVVHQPDGTILGVSTAQKVYVKKFKNFFCSVRFMMVPGYRLPGLLAKVTLMTRDLLEQFYKERPEEKCIGLIALIENEALKKVLRAPVLPSGFVYLGNSAAGHQIRVYYFKGTHIMTP